MTRVEMWWLVVILVVAVGFAFAFSVNAAMTFVWGVALGATAVRWIIRSGGTDHA